MTRRRLSGSQCIGRSVCTTKEVPRHARCNIGRAQICVRGHWTRFQFPGSRIDNEFWQGNVITVLSRISMLAPFVGIDRARLVRARANPPRGSAWVSRARDMLVGDRLSVGIIVSACVSVKRLSRITMPLPRRLQ